jgi:hypothetical protein
LLVSVKHLELRATPQGAVTLPLLDETIKVAIFPKTKAMSDNPDTASSTMWGHSQHQEGMKKTKLESTLKFNVGGGIGPGILDISKRPSPRSFKVFRHPLELLESRPLSSSTHPYRYVVEKAPRAAVASSSVGGRRRHRSSCDSRCRLQIAKHSVERGARAALHARARLHKRGNKVSSRLVPEVKTALVSTESPIDSCVSDTVSTPVKASQHMFPSHRHFTVSQRYRESSS